ncbi:MAG: molybdate ABC transporter permease subunit [Deltaproteobacteria bacterium]|nr:molybdate ABC transporter permease subunit [Deltaproteobacteria bacterium]
MRGVGADEAEPAGRAVGRVATSRTGGLLRWLGGAAATALLLALVLPLLALALSTGTDELAAGLHDPSFFPALGLSLRTSLWSLAAVIAGGTPLAYAVARSERPSVRWVERLVDLPVVLPPAVLGVGLLAAFGRQGLFGGGLEALGVQVAFSEAAVVLAQTVVAAPFFVQSAIAAFRQVDPDALLVARTLGASAEHAMLRVALPAAAPGLIAGAGLAWARALGEFGATLLFAGNLVGRTQTLPLAIYAALEQDVRVAVALALVLGGVGTLLLLGLRGLPALLRRRSGGAFDVG